MWSLSELAPRCVGRPRKKAAAFSISCVRTVHVHAVCSVRTLPFDFFYAGGFGAMFVHIRQRVREQPDTGYRKCRRADFAAARLNFYLGGGRLCYCVKCCQMDKSVI